MRKSKKQELKGWSQALEPMRKDKKQEHPFTERHHTRHGASHSSFRMSNKAAKRKVNAQLEKASLMRQPAPIRFARKMRQLISSHIRPTVRIGVKKDAAAKDVLVEVKAISKALQGTKLPSVVLQTGGRSRGTPKLTKAGQSPWVWNDPMVKLYYPQPAVADGAALESPLPDSLKDTVFERSGVLPDDQ
jgi:hypothetical protein